MGSHHGNSGVVKVGANTVAEVKEYSIDSGANIVDDTVMGDEWETHKAGKKKWTGSLNCQWDETDATGQEALTEGASVTLNLYPEGTGTGAKYLTGTCTVDKITLSASHDGIVMRAFTFTGNGSLAWATA